MNRNEEIKLRPFDKEIAQPDKSPVAISGRISADQFVVSAFGQVVSLTTSAVTSDARGTFALVPPQTHQLAGRIRLLVAREYEELPGGQISIDLPLDPDGYRQALAQAGVTIAPDRINVVEPVQRGVSVFFDADGRVDGAAWVGDGR